MSRDSAQALFLLGTGLLAEGLFALALDAGAVVVAGAVVLEDLSEHALVAVVPAVIKKRGIDAR